MLKNLIQKAANVAKCTLLIAGLSVGMAGVAQGAGLQDILKSGNVTIGVLLSAPPNGYLDENGQLVGLDPDVATKLGEYLGVKAKLVPLANPARIPALQSGQVDFLVASLAPTPERAKTMMFSIPYAANEVVFVAGKDDNYTDYASLAGKRVGFVRGSPQDAAMTKMALPDVELLRYDDASITMQALLSGQVDLVINDQSVINQMLSKRPDLNLKTQFPFSKSYFSATVANGDYELLQWLNTTISYMKSSGDLDALAQKWMGGNMPNLPTF